MKLFRAGFLLTWGQHEPNNRCAGTALREWSYLEKCDKVLALRGFLQSSGPQKPFYFPAMRECAVGQGKLENARTCCHPTTTAHTIGACALIIFLVQVTTPSTRPCPRSRRPLWPLSSSRNHRQNLNGQCQHAMLARSCTNAATHQPCGRRGHEG
jgi:hypothetical protein